MTKKLLSLSMAVMMLLSLSAAASAAPWDETVNDGFTNVLLNESVEGIFGADTLITDPTFETVGSEWSTALIPDDAADKELADAAAHGKVVEIVDTTEDTNATDVKFKVNTDTLSNSWIVVQFDVYLKSIEDNADAFVDISNGTGRIFRIVSGTENVRVGHHTNGTTVETPEGVTVPTGQWTTVTVMFTHKKDENNARQNMKAWIGDTLVSENAILNAGAADTIRLRAKYATAYWDNFQVWTEADVVGSPLAVNSYAAAAKASFADSPVADDNHGKVIAITDQGGGYTIVYSDHLIVNPDYVENGATAKAVADLSLIKVEADVYIPEGTTEGSTVQLTVRNGQTEDKCRIGSGDLITVDGTTTGWHHVAMYVDVDNLKYTCYVDEEIAINEEKAGYTSWKGSAAPASVGLRVNGLDKDNGDVIYFDNIKLSVPEYKDNAVTTVQTGENSFKLAYKCSPTAAYPAALLIGAVKNGNTLEDVELRASTGLDYETLVVTAKKTNAADTISKYLWKDLATLEPLIAAE